MTIVVEERRPFTLVHAGRGFQIVWSGAPGSAAEDRPLFERLLTTFTFED